MVGESGVMDRLNAGFFAGFVAVGFIIVTVAVMLAVFVDVWAIFILFGALGVPFYCYLIWRDSFW